MFYRIKPDIPTHSIINSDLIIGAIIGALFTFIGAVAIEYIKRYYERKNQEKKNKNTLKALEQEIEEGIKRSEGLIGFLENNKVSFSKIYTEYWTSSNKTLIQYFNDVEILNILHHIYYRFDLINFNMNQGRLGVGAAFAKEYIDEIKKNFEDFQKKIDKI